MNHKAKIPMKPILLKLFLFLMTIVPAKLLSQEIVVSKDSSTGTYKTINEAIQSVPKNSDKEIIILIKNGIYREKVLIDRPNITLMGESRSGVQIIYPILSTQWDEEVKKLTPEELKLQWGNGSVNLTNQANDCSLVNLTIYNNYGSTVEKTTSHQFSVFGRATRTIIIGCDIFSDGNDDVALWNKDGVYYLADCYFRCTGVDYVCPRGSCFVENSKFVGNKSAQIWHDGSNDKDYKFVIKNSSFDAIEPSWLGRYHHDSHFYLIGCTFSEMIIDRPIGYAYAPEREPVNMKWGHRVYFYDCQRGKQFEWAKDNLETAPNSPTVDQITPEWCFSGRWDPMPKVEQLRAKIKN